MVLRPGQIRAAAAESAIMIPAAAGLQERYPQLSVPAIIMAGGSDRHVDPGQSERLSRNVRASTLRIVPGVGHMVHHIAQEEVLAAMDDAAAMAEGAAAPRRKRDGEASPAAGGELTDQ